jgi:3'-5' exoribonuclease
MLEYIKDLKSEERVNSIFSVKYKHPPKEYKNGFSFTIGLADRTGEIEATYWGGAKEKVQELYNSFKESDAVRIFGRVEEFKGRLRISINPLDGGIKKEEKFDLERFVPTAKRNIEELTAKLFEQIESIKNPSLKALLEAFFKDPNFLEKFKSAPAAMYIHHAYVGGLLEHTLNVTFLCQATLSLYPSLDRDLLISGALLHDIGKTKEFVVTTNIKISEEGMLRGHIPLGEEMLLERMGKDFPQLLRMKLCHILLAHHGKGEYNSPVSPEFPEAALVYYADELDAKLFQYLKLKEETETEDFHVYSKRLGQIYLK